MTKQGYIYILTNERKTVLYIGVTSDLQKRVYQHKNGLGSVFTKKYRLKNLVHFEVFSCIVSAIEREKALKGITRKKKEALISIVNPLWQDLSLDMF
jgi:putative endonuclease